MAIVVTENWSAASLSIVPPWKAYREFAVTGTANQDEALEAAGVPQRDDPHPRNATLTAEGPHIARVLGPEYFHVGVEYTISEKDDSDGGDHLSRVAELSWAPIVRVEPVDRDLSNRVIQNSATFPITGASRTIEYDELTIKCYMPYFDHTLNQQFRNSVNHQAIEVDGMPVEAEHMRFVRAMPGAAYKPGAQYVQMNFTFEVFFDDQLGRYPFQHRFLDQGDAGWYDDGGTKRTKRFSDGAGELLFQAVRLDGAGRPLAGIHDGVKVGEGNEEPVTPELGPVNAYAREYYDEAGTRWESPTASTVAVFLYYEAVRVVNFTPLLSLLNAKLQRGA
jgi:hypothetical protein